MKPKFATWDSEIEARSKALERAVQQRALFEPVPEPDFKYDLVTGSSPRLIIYRLEDLHAARELLGTVYGKTWTDEIDSRFFSCGRTITVWKAPDRSWFPIWLECRVEDYPDELMGEHCKWHKSGSSETSYHFSCAVPQEGDTDPT